MLRNDLALGRRVWLMFGLLGLCAMAGPARAQICTPFNDVPAASGFCGNIQWMYNRGITLGCTAPPGQTWYCPADFVRRDQMAAFMYRLGFQNALLRGGNAFAATATLGTTDNHAVEVVTGNARVMRYEPNAISANVIGGSPGNNVTAGVRGATIGGGGVATGNTDPNFDFEGPNLVTDVYGTVGGGYNNRAGNNAGTVVDAPFATVAGGGLNEASASYATVGGGGGNEAQRSYATVAGGELNFAQGEHGSIGGGKENLISNVLFATVAGGFSNWANAHYAAIGGGGNNTASGVGSTIGGGGGNWARGYEATVPGGDLNEANGDYSVAMGRRAIVNGIGVVSFRRWKQRILTCYIQLAQRVCRGRHRRHRDGHDPHLQQRLPAGARGRVLGLRERSRRQAGLRRRRRSNDPAQSGRAADHHLAFQDPAGNGATHGPDVAGLPCRLRARHRRQDDHPGRRQRRCAGGDPGLEREARRRARSQGCGDRHAAGELAAIRSVLATFAESRPTQTAVVRP